MVDKTLVLIGASSEIGVKFYELCNEVNIKTFSISRHYKTVDKKQGLKVEDYLGDYKLIKKELKKLKNVTVIFFNGALYENRPEKFPSDEEIFLTKIINYEIPLELTKKLSFELQNIEKFIFISSMAAVKLRYKNFIYGGYKRELEQSVKSLSLNSYLFIRFGKVFTKMSEGHRTPPFSMTSKTAAKVILKNLTKTKIIYGNRGLYFISKILIMIPQKILFKLNI